MVKIYRTVQPKEIAHRETDIKVVMLDSPYRSIINPIVEYVLSLDKTDDQLVTVILPEIVPAKRWH